MVGSYYADDGGRNNKEMKKGGSERMIFELNISYNEHRGRYLFWPTEGAWRSSDLRAKSKEALI